MKYLLDELENYRNSGIYPFHMPGHKRKTTSFPNPYEIDITEIDGFDNLHHAKGLILEAQQRASALYGSKDCFYLVNGSTCGLLAAICAAIPKGGKALVARNCHKAVYHALFLNEIRAEYLYPEITESGIQGQICVKQVEEALRKHSDADAVILTSPTYEGIVSDISGIAKAVHARKIPLIVDEAHGAHFGFDRGFPENAVRLGADAVIMSLHKTLPSFTQTALLHLCSDLISKEQVKRYLGIFQTSSPSYLFMAGMDACIRQLRNNGAELFLSFRKKLEQFYQDTADLKGLHVMRREDVSGRAAYDLDQSKLVIFTHRAKMTGEELHRKLLSDYKIQMEMVSDGYVLGMTSIFDEETGFSRLSRALHEIDNKIERNMDNKIEKQCDGDFIRQMYPAVAAKFSIHEALKLPSEELSFREAAGRIAAEYLYLFPPGIPLIVPGEEITEELVRNLGICLDRGLCVEGFADSAKSRIKIVYSERLYYT